MDPRFQDPNWQQGGRFNPVPGYPTNNQLFGIQSWLNNIQSGIGSGQINSNNAGQYSQLLGQLQNTLGGFSSSSMPQLNANAWGAMMNASSPLFNGFGQASAGPDISGLLGSNSNLFNDWMQQFRNYQDQRFGLGNQILDSQYNTALGQQSQQYNQASQEINRQREGAQQMAQYSASILNPYGGPASASAAQGYSGAINQLYNTQAQNLQAQADQARQALQSGNIQAHMQLQAQMLDSQQQFQQNMQNFMLGLNQQDIQNRQFQYGVLDKAQDNLRQFIQMSGVPQSLIGKDPSQWSMQEVAPYLQYAISQGISPDRAMQVIPALLSGQTMSQQRLDFNQRQQMALETYRDNMLALGWAKLAESQSKQTQAELRSGVIASVAGVPMPKVDAPENEWSNYYKQVAQLTSGGATDFRISQTLGDMEGVISQFPQIKKSIDTLDKSDPIFNAAAGYLPYSQKVATLQGELNRVLSVLSRSFGEKGVLTDQDINRVAKGIGTVSQPSQVRNKLYSELVKIMSEKYMTNIATFARQGYDVSAYGPTIDRINTLSSMSIPASQNIGTNIDFSNYMKQQFGVTIK